MIEYNTLLKILANKRKMEIIKLLNKKEMYQAEIAKLTHIHPSQIRGITQSLEQHNIIKSEWKTIQTTHGKQKGKYYRLQVDLDLEGIENCIKTKIKDNE